MKKAKLSFTHAHSTYKSSKRDGKCIEASSESSAQRES